MSIIFGNDNQQFILLTEPVRYDLLSQVIEDKRANIKDELIEYADRNQQTAVTVTFFNNNITSPEDCDAFIEKVYQNENGRLFKCGFDFATVIQRSEVIIDPNFVGRDLVEALYPGRTRYKPQRTTALSKYRTPIDVEQDSVEKDGYSHQRMPTQRYLLAHNRESKYKATQYYITYTFQAELQIIRGYQYQILTPTAVDSTIQAKNYIKTISYDNTQDNFVEQWLDQVFSEALQIRDNNKFADDVPQRYEVHVIGFDQIDDQLGNDMVGGNLFVNHRENIAGKTQIHKIKLQHEQISENCLMVELEKKTCSYSTPLQVAYFTMHNSKYFYLNTYYNFLAPCLDMDYIHVIYGDTDSLRFAIAHESWPIKDKKLWDQLYSQLLPSTCDDNYYDKKKILGRNIESKSTICLALAPKQNFKMLHGKSPDQIQDIPPDYQIMPLSKLNRPYFSPKLGQLEIDLVFSMDQHIIRANQIYLFCININTKYLVVFPLGDKSAGKIKNALQILVKNYHVTNIRGDGEKGFNGTILKSFRQEHIITSFFTDYRNSLIKI
ncbi:MAG: hypothetical protein EZS28_012087 [Streblomastix strix]|uniref:Integrase catalytic domain-containing protein n=1 Tax=Streblomastix strix TaxID=222440 RepID=A0A5J4WD58_9EUKA|nr:MAG: hypothetical protein EZS28_012087 [Streblomastix strix]